MHDDLVRQEVEEQTINDIDAIGAEATRLLRIVEESQELSAAHVLPGERKIIDIAPVIERIARMYEPILQRNGTRLSVDLAPNLPQVEANADEIIQVLFNLLNNAGKYAKHGEVQLTAAQIGGCLRIKVADNGLGIPAQLLPHVFERHVHGDQAPGTGLGLAICQDIIEAHKGFIEINSVQGEGTSVIIMLPVCGGWRGEENGEAISCDTAG
jgi:signal transduction histidine kinase